MPVETPKKTLQYLFLPPGVTNKELLLDDKGVKCESRNICINLNIEQNKPMLVKFDQTRIYCLGSSTKLSTVVDNPKCQPTSEKKICGTQ